MTEKLSNAQSQFLKLMSSLDLTDAETIWLLGDYLKDVGRLGMYEEKRHGDERQIGYGWDANSN